MWRRKSWLVKEFLEERDFDAVFFNEHHGSGYYTLAAKRAGIPRFKDRTHCVITHGSIEWVFDVNDQYIARPSDIEMIGLERRSVEWADVVIGPSEYLLRKYESYGWSLPERTYVQPYPFRLPPVEPSSAPVDVNELVFFGRLETRKGLWLFCEALDRISEKLRGRVVTFMGRVTDVGGVPSAALILAKASHWPFRVRLLMQLNQSDAIDYLKQPGRLAVMPSLADNSPCVIYECLDQRIPFVATSGTGADELIALDCWDDVMVEPSVRALSERLSTVLDRGAALARPRFDAEDNLRAWSALGHWLGTAGEAGASGTPDREAPAPFGSRRMLLVTLDFGGGAVGALADQIARHAKRYGGSMKCMILTSRRGEARALLEELVSSSVTSAAVRVLGTDVVDAAIEAIGSADIVFFTDADHEVLPHFVVAAMSAITQRGVAAVSCVSAERQEADGPLRITELPCGDLPAAGGLGLPIGSSVWGARSEDIRGLLTRDAIYREEADDLVPAFDLGQALMHRLILSEKEVVLVPTVGAIRTRHAGGFTRRRHWYGDAVATARSLGIAPFVHSGGAAWLGINAARQTRPFEPEEIAGLGLPPEHPLNLVDQTGTSLAGLSRLAAAMGRPDQAIGLRSDWDEDLSEARSLLELAQTAAEVRRRIDLMAVLVAQRSGRRSSFLSDRGSAPEMEGEDLRQRLLAAMARRKGVDRNERPKAQPRSQADLSDEAGGSGELVEALGRSASLGTARAFSEGIELRPAEDASQVSLGMISSGRLTFVDVPLAGHQRIVADLSFGEQLAPRVRLRVFDQVTGGEIARAEGGVLGQGRPRVMADLPGVFELVCVEFVVEVEGGSPGTPLGLDLKRFIID